MYDYLNKIRTEVVFTEEGHLTKSEQLEVKRELLGQVMHLHSIQRQRGGVEWAGDGYYCRRSYHFLWMKAFLIRHGDMY